MDRDQWHLVMQNLEFLAGGWEKLAEEASERAERQRANRGHAVANENDARALAWQNAAGDLRTLLIAYLEPELAVRYFYAGEWRLGVLLVHPPKDPGYWQIQRSGIGAMVDRVPADADRIRVYVEGTKAPTEKP